MTESDWLQGTDPDVMIAFLREEQTHFRTRWLGWVSRPRFRVSERKWRLFYCACMRRIAPLFPKRAASLVIDAAERWADGEMSQEQFQHAVDASIVLCQETGNRFWTLWEEPELINALRQFHSPDEETRFATLRMALQVWTGRVVSTSLSRENAPDPQREEAAEKARQAVLLREVVGNPFHARTVDAVWLAWQDSTIPRMARTIYDERRFEDLPILADALEDAGCCDEAILTHCRAETDHVRGCWVVDLLLSLT